MADMEIVLDSLGWALLHSLWQITVIGLTVFAALRLVRRDQPALRCAIAYAGMVVSLLAFMATFLAGLQAAPAAGTALFVPPDAGLVVLLDRATDAISLAWAIGFALLSVRYAVMIRATHRLRAEGLSEVPSLWQQRLAVWADRLGAGSVRIFESALVRTPLTLGMFRPVILVPAGFFLRLPRDQAEAVLVHELAHICRQDYLLGLIQAFIANVFFFHPAIYYLSRQVDLEREHACDARAALETGDMAALAKGLSRVAIDMHDKRIGFAMAARGRHAVVERIRRLGELRGRKNPDDRTPAVALAMLFGAGIIFALAVDSKGGAKGDEQQLARLSVTPALPAAAVADPAEAAESVAATPDGRATAEPAQTEASHAKAADDRMKYKVEAEKPAEPARVPRGDRRDGDVFAVSFAGRGWGPMPVSGMFQQAVYQVQQASPFARAALPIEGAWRDKDEDCDEAERRAEAIAAREEARAEAYAARAEARAEAHAARVEAQAERAAELAVARAERQAERIAREEERRAEALEARMEAIADRTERLAEQKQAREERERERRVRDRERRERQLEFENQSGRPVVTISFIVPVAPAAPGAPQPAMVSFQIPG